MLRRLILATALLLACGSVTPANPSIAPEIAQAPPGQPSLRQNRGAWLRDLNLSPEQMQRIRAIQNQYQGRIRQERQAYRQAQRELRNLMAGNASVDTLRRQYNDAKAIRQRLADLQFESLLAMREVLTPAQRRKFADRMEQQRDMMKERLLKRL